MRIVNAYATSLLKTRILLLNHMQVNVVICSSTFLEESVHTEAGNGVGI